jgi:hypothetical protein
VDAHLRSTGRSVDDVSAEIASLGGYNAWKLANATANAQYGRNFVNSLHGFSDDISLLASQHGLTTSDFKLLQQKRYEAMSPNEKAIVESIRNSVAMPDANTLLQKAIPLSQLHKYLDGDYTQIGGFVTTAKDAKHLVTYDDIYTGMRLDYTNTAFNLSDDACVVVRYKTANPDANVAMFPEVVDPPAPYTANGFTGGNQGRLGVPEWVTPYNTPVHGAELIEVSSDGSETLIAIFYSSQNKFIAVQ